VKKEEKATLVREILGQVADKWTLVLIDELGEETVRFADLRRRAGGISAKVLTQTLRGMERNGLVRRVVYPQVPPRVEYSLTAVGAALGEAVCGIWTWTEAHFAEVLASRSRFDTKARGARTP
jgi:DNA-binding HxlR family transcriptional regulator